MILDRGTCTVYRKESTTEPGGKPKSELVPIHESYYGELSFETAPFRPTEKREETRTAARVRILQNRKIRNQDVAELTPFDGTEGKTEKYRITRAWHGDDSDSGQPISDLTLEVTEKPNIQKAVTPTQSTGGSSSGNSAGSGSQAPEVNGNDGQ